MQVRAPIEELHDSQLYRFMAKQDGAYAQRVTTFVRGVAPILTTTARYFPYYTRHDAHHGFRVTERIAQVLDPECLQSGHDKSLLPSEVFLLIAAAYAHDLGMTVFPGEEDQLIADLGLERAANWEISQTLQDYLRRNHSKRGGDYIHANAEALGVPVNLVGALDLMMKSHNFSIAKLDRELRDPFAAQEHVIDVRQLAVVLCIADALEFSDTRVVDGGELDAGNARFAGQESLIVFDNVFVPYQHVFMDGG